MPILRWFLSSAHKGSLCPRIRMNFRKISERGGEGHFRSKKFYCNFFCIRNCNFGNEFAEKIAMKFSEKGAGGGRVKGRSEIFQKFIRIRGHRLPLCADERNQRRIGIYLSLWQNTTFQIPNMTFQIPNPHFQYPNMPSHIANALNVNSINRKIGIYLRVWPGVIVARKINRLS